VLLVHIQSFKFSRAKLSMLVRASLGKFIYHKSDYIFFDGDFPIVKANNSR